jgi:hypothetical protein
MKGHLFNYWILFFLSFGVVSCSDLEEDLRGEITEEIHQDDGNNIAVCFGPNGYLVFRDAGTANHGGYFTLQEVTSDEMVIGVKGNDWASGGAITSLHQHTYTPDHPFVNGTFSQTYGAIVTLNDFLGNNEIIPEEMAQARGLRAYFYWRLLDLYGRVKIVTEIEPDPPQATRVEVFNFVEKELLDILGISEVRESMDFSNSPLADGGSAYILNRYGALGILAKLYLNAEVYTGMPMYEQAAWIAAAIINSGHYQLCDEGCRVNNLGRRVAVESDPEYLEGYAAVFAPNNEGNPEHIFAIMYDELTGPGMNFSQMNLHYASQRTWHLDQQPWNGYATLEEFYNSYEDQDTRKKANFLAGPQFDYGGSALLDYNYDDDYIQLNYTPQINELYPNYLRQAGVRPAKFSYKLFGKADMDNDFPLVRLGEIYLIRAEAIARQTGNWSDAESDVNILRARAGVIEYDGDLTEDEFLAERGREMFQEAVRRTDLIRFGRYNDPWWEKQPSEPYRNVFPIPRGIFLGPDWTQNPGY